MRLAIKMANFTLAVAALLSFHACDKDSGNINRNPFENGGASSGYVRTSYTNPVVNESIPDPTVIRGDDGLFYMMGTEDVRNMVIYKSKDMITWAKHGFAFSEGTRPRFISDGMMWAPEANKIGNLYLLYYTLANPGTGRFGIGVATATSPGGPYSDTGKIIEQGVDVNTGGVSIDQFIYSENGHTYLFYGCYGGIYYIELTSNGRSVLNGTPRQLAGSDYEGTMIHKHGDYYYYFGSLNGYQQNYQLAVARSTSLLGPYTNKSGKSIMEHGGYEVAFSGNKVFSNTGHCLRIITDAGGNDWIFLHAYTVSKNNDCRYPHMYKVEWDEDGWPVIGNKGYPMATVKEVPVIDSNSRN